MAVVNDCFKLLERAEIGIVVGREKGLDLFGDGDSAPGLLNEIDIFFRSNTGRERRNRLPFEDSEYHQDWQKDWSTGRLRPE